MLLSISFRRRARLAAHARRHAMISSSESEADLACFTAGVNATPYGPITPARAAPTAPHPPGRGGRSASLLSDPRARLLRQRDRAAVGLEPRDPHRRVAARQRRARARQRGREHLLLADRAGEGRPGAEGAARDRPAPRCPERCHGTRADPRLPAAADPAGDHPGAAGRGRLARDVRARRRATAGAGHELPTDPDYPQLVAGVAWIDHTAPRRGCIPGSTSRRVDCPPAGPRRSRPRCAPRARRDVQQRLQDEGLGRRRRDRRAHIHAAQERLRDVRALPRRPRRRRSRGTAGRVAADIVYTPGRTCR